MGWGMVEAAHTDDVGDAQLLCLCLGLCVCSVPVPTPRSQSIHTIHNPPKDRQPARMYRRCAPAAAAAAAASSSSSSARPRSAAAAALLLRHQCRLLAPHSSQHPQQHPRFASTLARATATTGLTAKAVNIPAAAAAVRAGGPVNHTPMSLLPAMLSTHAATGQSASEFLDDPGLLRDQAYVNGEWVDAIGEATFAVEGACLS